MLSISQFVHPSVSVIFVCLFTFEVPFKHIFAPASQSRMSKINGDSESLGKSNGKKWSQIYKLLLIKSVKFPRKKKYFLDKFCLTEQVFLVSIFLTSFNNIFAPTSQSPMSKLLRFSESLGKSNWNKWSQIWEFSINGVKLPRWKKFLLQVFHLFTPLKRLFAPTS